MVRAADRDVGARPIEGFLIQVLVFALPLPQFQGEFADIQGKLVDRRQLQETLHAEDAHVGDQHQGGRQHEPNRYPNRAFHRLSLFPLPDRPPGRSLWISLALDLQGGVRW